MTNEEWLENLDIGDALELFDALVYHIDGNFSELNLTYLAEEAWKKLLNEYSNYGRRVYEEYASEIRGREWKKIKDWGAINPCALTTFDPAGPHETFSLQSISEEHLNSKRSMLLGQNAVNNQSILVDPTKLNSPHLMILGKPGASVWKRSFALQELKQGKISVEDLLNTQDECLKRILIYDLLRAYKGIGNARARKIMKELHIVEARRIADLDKPQHAALLDFIQECDL